MKVKFTKNEVFFTVLFGVLICVFFFVYSAKKKELIRAKSELAQMQGKVGEAELMSLGPAAIINLTKALENGAAGLKKGLIGSDEEALARFYKLAERYGVKISSINRPGLAAEVSGKEWAVLEKPVKCVRLDISLTGAYIKVGKFLEGVREDFNNLVVLDRLYISRAAADEVAVALGATVYLLPN